MEISHRTASLCHLGNIAMRLGRKIPHEPKTQQCLNGAEANAMLQRPYRGPWKLSV
jgi:hypothetical protein